MRTLLPALILVGLTGCQSQKIVSNWKSDALTPQRLQKIAVVAILPDEDSVFRKDLETAAVNSFRQYGYHAISGMEAFGAKGLAATNQEATYLTLCQNGVDAVMTIALVPVEPHEPAVHWESYVHPNEFYYNRIFNYKKKLAPLVNNHLEGFYWESILFDVFTLQAVSVLQSRTIAKNRMDLYDTSFPESFVKKMAKEKIIRKKSPALKAF